MIEEIWKEIPGYEGCYMASSLGRIKSLDRFVKCGRRGVDIIKGKVLKQVTDRFGYCQLSLSRPEIVKSVNCLVHRLVAIAFIENPNNKKCVNHINGIKTDNRVENLEWCTPMENIAHAERTGLRNSKGSNNGNSKLTEERVSEIKNTKTNMNNKEAAKFFGIDISCYRRIKCGINWKHVA